MSGKKIKNGHMTKIEPMHPGMKSMQGKPMHMDSNSREAYTDSGTDGVS